MKWADRFKSLPKSTKNLLVVGVLLALIAALPLFIWAVTTQKFLFSQKAQVATGEQVPYLTITTDSFIDGYVGQPYRNFFYAEESNFTSDPTLTLSASNLPPGFSTPPELCGTEYPQLFLITKRIFCALDGLPTTPGEYQITINFSDNSGHSVTRDVPFRVLASAPPSPTPTPTPPPNSCPGPNGASCTYYNCPVCTDPPHCPLYPCGPETGTCINNICIPETLPCVPLPDCPSGASCVPPPPAGTRYCTRHNFGILFRFDGVNDDSADGAKVSVRFVGNISGKNVDLVTQVPPTAHYVVGSAGVYRLSMSINSDLPAGTNYSVILKGEKHGFAKFCKSEGQNSYCTASTVGQIGIPDTTSTISLDFRGFPLPAGDTIDINTGLQDGVINYIDYDRIFAILSKPIQTTDDLRVGDLNYDGKVNTLDILLLLRSLSAKYDEY